MWLPVTWPKWLGSLLSSSVSPQQPVSSALETLLFQIWSPREEVAVVPDGNQSHNEYPTEEIPGLRSFISEDKSLDFAAWLKTTAKEQHVEDNPVQSLAPKSCAMDWELVYETKPEVQRMDEAVLSNNLGNVQATFKSEWLDKPESERIKVDKFGVALASAVEINSVSIVSFLISIGLTPHKFLLDYAVRTHSDDVVKLLLTEHMDINEPWNEWEPPPLG